MLAVSGIALAVASAGLGMFIASSFGSEDTITAYSAEPVERAPVATPTPDATEPASPTGNPTTPATATATSTPTQRPANTPTPTRTATPTRTPTPAPSPTPTPTVPGTALEQSLFNLPGDATPNGGGAIGPYSGRGRTVTVRSAAGAIVGYVYWYRWAGQAYTFSGGDAIPDIRVLVHDVNAGEAAIALSAGEVSAGVTRSVEVGSLKATVTFTSASHTSYGGATYLWESSLAATLEVAMR